MSTPLRFARRWCRRAGTCSNPHITYIPIHEIIRFIPTKAKISTEVRDLLPYRKKFHVGKRKARYLRTSQLHSLGQQAHQSEQPISWPPTRSWPPQLPPDLKTSQQQQPFPLKQKRIIGTGLKGATRYLPMAHGTHVNFVRRGGWSTLKRQRAKRPPCHILYNEEGKKKEKKTTTVSFPRRADTTETPPQP